MKKNDFQEIKGLNMKALQEKVRVLKGELADLVLDKNMSKLKDLKSLAKKKKDVAQILTVMKQKELLEKLTGDSGQLIDKKEDPKIEVKKTEKGAEKK